MHSCFSSVKPLQVFVVVVVVFLTCFTPHARQLSEANSKFGIKGEGECFCDLVCLIMNLRMSGKDHCYWLGHNKGGMHMSRL